MEDWTEKYRPTSLNGIVGNERSITELRKWANSWNNGIPKKRAVILSGKPGTGKTSSAIALAHDLGWVFIELNTSDARNAVKIKNVATSGSINETFDNSGNFINSKSGGRKLIILDEADNLYEKSAVDNKSGNDLSDRGGKKAIVETIKTTSQPIILIVNNYYNLIKGSGDALKKMCLLIRFYDPYPSVVFSLLRRICFNEHLNVDQNVLHAISDRCKGDIRSAVNDLQSICLDKKHVDMQSLDVLGYRDREKIIFNALREIFKTKDIQSIRKSILNLDEDPNSVILWINENMPSEYRDFNDLVNGYDALSKADVFLGRTHRRQNYALWSYASDFMNGGVAVAKTRIYQNEKYNFPTWLRNLKSSKPTRDACDSIAKKISKTCHSSSGKSKYFLLTYFVHMFRNDTVFAVKMKNKYDLSESEIKYILGKAHLGKLKEILNPPVEVDLKSVEKPKTTGIPDESDKKENIQQSLFDF